MSVSLILYSISDILGKKMSYMTTVYGLPQKSSIKSLFSGLYSFFFLNATVHRFFFFFYERSQVTPSLAGATANGEKV